MDGWIKLYRKMWDNPIVTKDAEHIAIWLYLLTHAMFADTDVTFRGERITIHPGQQLIGTLVLAKRLGISDSKTYRVLKKFESEKQIEIQTSNKCSLISIVNWDLYQTGENQNEKQVKSKRKTSENKIINKELNNINNSISDIFTQKVQAKKSSNKFHNFNESETVYPTEMEMFNELVGDA